MKKLFIIPFLFLLFSCSTDDSETPILNLNEMLIEQVDVVYANNTSFSKNYYYVNGNELESVTSLNGDEEYTYEDGYITKIKYTSSSGAIDERFFTYDTNGILIEEVKLYYLNSVGERIVFTYPNETTVTTNRYGGDLNSQNTLESTGVYILENGSFNILNFTETTLTNPQTRILTYLYDNKKSVTHGIKDNMKGFEYIFSGENNVSNYNFNLNDQDVYSYSSSFIYNTDIYPTSENQTDQTGAVNRYSFYYY
ncbi:hypothetical protein [Maribacter sp. IgM3_T14_3]|uniref:hypothetical protein n=1 Tax=Maribacter sp. IgM3_T14_3 TaxID=3415140 RepID=UPI003C6EB6DB